MVILTYILFSQFVPESGPIMLKIGGWLNDSFEQCLKNNIFFIWMTSLILWLYKHEFLTDTRKNVQPTGSFFYLLRRAAAFSCNGSQFASQFGSQFASQFGSHFGSQFRSLFIQVIGSLWPPANKVLDGIR